MPLCSGPSTRPSFLRFINKSDREVNLFWIGYDGRAVNYTWFDQRNRHRDIDCYEGHLWFVTDASVGTRLVLNKERVFHSTAGHRDDGPALALQNKKPFLRNGWNQRVINDNEDLSQTTREIVYITLPVLSLLQRSAEVVNAYLRRRRCYPYYHGLNIPKELIIKLHEFEFVRDYNIRP